MVLLKDFATPSLNSRDTPTNAGVDGDGDGASDDEDNGAAEVVQLCLRRRWETRYE